MQLSCVQLAFWNTGDQTKFKSNSWVEKLAGLALFFISSRQTASVPGFYSVLLQKALTQQKSF